ncbi:MAG: hypothetical protein P8I86_09860, partial [Luminiphilus sp.]|nr:hypothetical protein [Luminiphilus sp.]
MIILPTESICNQDPYIMLGLSNKMPLVSYASLAVCLSLFALAGQAQTITFEKLPDNSDPVDNLQLPLNTVFQIGLTGLSFGYDIDGDKIADQGVVMEQRGNNDVVGGTLTCSAYTNAYSNMANLLTEEDNTVSGEGGQWLIREKRKCANDVDPSGNVINQETQYSMRD